MHDIGNEVTWAKAKEICLKRNSSLYMDTDPPEKLTEPPSGYWIGLQRRKALAIVNRIGRGKYT